MSPEPAHPGSRAPAPPDRGAGGTSVHPMLRGRTGLSPVMIGRRNALARLHGLVDAAPVGADLRAADERGVTTVVAVLPPAEGLGHAIRDRLSKAAATTPGAAFT